MNQNISSNNQSIGTASVVHGTVEARSADNSVRVLQANSPVYFNDRIITGNNGMISIVFGDAAQTQLDLGRMSDVLLNEDVFQGPSPAEFSEAAAEVEQIQEALVAGDFDPTTDLEAPAAGPAAGGPESDGGGTSFVEFNLTAQAVTPTSGAETTGVDLNFLDPQPLEIEEEVVLAPEPEPEPEPVVTSAPVTEEPPPETEIPEALAVTIVDDVPTISLGEGRAVGFVQEDALGNELEDSADDDTDFSTGNLDADDDTDTASLNLADLLVTTPGADEPASVSYSIANLGTGVKSDYTSNGQEVWYYDQDGKLVARAGNDGNPAGTVVFTFAVDSSTGTATFNLDDQLDHPEDSDDDTNLTIEGLGSYVQAQIVDADGDIASVTFTGKIDINVENDIPILNESPIVKTVQEDALGNFEGIEQGDEDSSTGNLEDPPGDADYAVFTVAELKSAVKAGADEEVSFSLVDSSASGTLAGIKSNNENITWSSNGSTITAVTAVTGTTVFEVRFDESGNLIFDLDDQVDHSFGAEGTDGELLASKIDVGQFVKATDFDGDSVNLAGQLLVDVENDVPVKADIDPIVKTVQEDALGNFEGIEQGDEDSSTGNLEDPPGDSDYAVFTVAELKSAVKAGADEEISFSLVDSSASGTLAGIKSNNENITWSSNGSTITAVTAVTGTTVFEVRFDESGNLIFDLDDQVDHSFGAEGTDGELLASKIDVGQFVKATDFDGDSVNLAGQLLVDVENDVPQAAVQPAAIIGTVLEDGLNYDEGDLSEGNRENGETVDDDEDAGSSNPADTSNLSNLFESGADEFLTFGITTDPNVLSELDTLYSQGDQLHYLSNGTILEANTEADGSGRSVFTLEVSTDGSWKFDLKDQLDHVDDGTNSENWALEGSGAPDGSIDFSSVITATDADGDTVTGAAPHSFRVEVQDDIPEAASTSQVPGNMNLVLILDNSGSMYTNNISFGGSTVSRADALQASVVALITSLATDSDAGSTYKIHIVEYNTDSAALGTFTIIGGDINSANAAIAAINGMVQPSSGDVYTNYEAGYQQALQWVTNGDPLTNADVDGTIVNQVLFFSDGDPNRWNDPDLGEAGGPIVQGTNSTTALQQVTGVDGTNEIAQLGAWADSVRAIGINVSDDGIDNNNDQDDRLDTLDLTGNALNITSGDQLLAVLPELLKVPAPIISATVEEDDLNVDGDALTDPDSSTGINEDGSSNADEVFGSTVSTDATNLSNLFISGADELLTYGLSSNLGALPTLYSGGTPLTYQVVGNTLTASAGVDTIFTFTVNSDGSWSFDLDGQLDHVAGDGENFELRTGDGTEETSGIDLSSVITATDADGDEAIANTGAFVINVQDDVPDVGTPQDSLLAIEEGNSLSASLDILGSGADSPLSINLKLTEGAEVKSIGGTHLTSEGDNLYWHDNGDGSWSAVTKDGSGNLDPSARSFTLSVDETAGTYSVVQDGVLDGASSVKTIDFNSALSGGNTYEAVFGSGGTSATVGEITTYTNGVFVWTKASQDLSDPFGWNGSNDTWVNDTTTVNYSASGVGVGTGAMIDGTGTSGATRDSEILSIKFFSDIEVDNSGTNKGSVRVNESNSTALDLTAVTLVLDHLGAAETSFYTLWNDGVQVSQEYQISGLDSGTGSSADSKDDLLNIDSSQLNVGETVFDEIRLESGSGGSNAYRIESAQISIFQEGADETILIPVEIEDADGDVIETDFSVTFDGQGDLDAASADAADGDISTSGMVISGSSGNDTIIGTDYDDTIDGGAGNDTIDGGAGNDTIEGGTGNDYLVGNIGDDDIFGDEGDDTLLGGAGEDQLIGGTGEDTLDGGEGDDVLVGDDVDFSDPDNPIIVEDGEPDVITGGTGIDIAGDQPAADPINDDTISAETTVLDIDTLVPPPDDIV